MWNGKVTTKDTKEVLLDKKYNSVLPVAVIHYTLDSIEVVTKANQKPENLTYNFEKVDQ